MRYGEYLLSYQDCRACHGDKLTGGVPGQAAPLGPDLSVVKRWKFQEFVATMRTGVDPNGHELDTQMPWRLIGRMGDVAGDWEDGKDMTQSISAECGAYLLGTRFHCNIDNPCDNLRRRFQFGGHVPLKKKAGDG